MDDRPIPDLGCASLSCNVGEAGPDIAVVGVKYRTIGIIHRIRGNSGLCRHSGNDSVSDFCKHAGAVIVTDTNMALAGITKPGLAKLGGTACCYMAAPEVAAAAKEAGTTRAVAAMKKAAQEHPGAILAVGNAPTALLTIAEQIESGLRPALVIGVPVGFVNVVESKERLFAVCEKHDVPAIVAMGRKGGSNVAAAICNALIYSAAEMQDPAARGWK